MKKVNGLLLNNYSLLVLAVLLLSLTEVSWADPDQCRIFSVALREVVSGGRGRQVHVAVPEEDISPYFPTSRPGHLAPPPEFAGLPPGRRVFMTGSYGETLFGSIAGYDRAGNPIMDLVEMDSRLNYVSRGRRVVDRNHVNLQSIAAEGEWVTVTAVDGRTYSNYFHGMDPQGRMVLMRNGSATDGVNLQYFEPRQVRSIERGAPPRPSIAAVEPARAMPPPLPVRAVPPPLPIGAQGARVPTPPLAQAGSQIGGLVLPVDEVRDGTNVIVHTVGENGDSFQGYLFHNTDGSISLSQNPQRSRAAGGAAEIRINRRHVGAVLARNERARRPQITKAERKAIQAAIAQQENLAIRSLIVPRDTSIYTPSGSAMIRPGQEVTLRGRGARVEVPPLRGRYLGFHQDGRVAIEDLANGRVHLFAPNDVASVQIPPNAHPVQLQQTTAPVPMAQIPSRRHPVGSRYQRQYPPLGEEDTVAFEVGGPMRSIHEPRFQPFIQDNEILHVHAVQRRTVDGMVYGVTADGHSVIQQQGTRGCTAAAAEMLIHDRGGAIDMRNLRTTNLGDSGTVAARIRSAGFQPLVTNFGPTNSERLLESLEQALRRNGPGDLGVSTEIGNHAIVLDAIDLVNHTAIIRDPWHGWRLTIPTSSLEEWLGNRATLVQIQR